MPNTAVFVQRLRELGWIDGRTVAIEYRWSEGRSTRYAEIAAEFVRLKVDVIVTSGIVVAAVKQATANIPIIFVIAQDPVGGGLVQSLARPGGNITGLSVQSSELAGKRLELLREVLPDVRRLALMGNVGYSQTALEMGEVRAKARTLGLQVVPCEIRRPEDIDPAFSSLGTQATQFISLGMLSSAPIASKSSRSRSVRVCPLYSIRKTISKLGVLCPTDRTSQTCFAAVPN
jgi:putative ABC transport system substrate-binding protein